MSNYLLKYKNTYRVLPEIDKTTNDFPRDIDGTIEDNDCYITCQHGNRIYTYGHVDNKRAVWLTAYIPSLIRGRNIRRYLNENNINYNNYSESDSEVTFRFIAKDIGIIAPLLKAKTSGARIGAFSIKNLPKADVEIPSDEIKRYKEITSRIEKGDLLIIHNITNKFMDDILQKKLRKYNGASFNYKVDIKKRCMARQVKEYIWCVGMWDDFLKYLSEEIKMFYSNR